LGDGFRTAVRTEQAMYGQGVIDCVSKKNSSINIQDTRGQIEYLIEGNHLLLHQVSNIYNEKNLRLRMNKINKVLILNKEN
jgi:hypothetical protein